MSDGADTSASIGSLMLGGADVISGWLTNYHTNKANIRMANEAWEREVEMWNMQNRYNSPARQMERLRAAGLNPNLIYGSGSNAGNVAKEMPRYNKPEIKERLPTEMLGKYNDLRRVDMQQNMVDSAVINRNAETLNKIASNQLIKTKGQRAEFDLGVKKLLRNVTIDLEHQKLQNLQQTWQNLNQLNKNYKNDYRLKEVQRSFIEGQTSLNQLEFEFRKIGISYSDGILFRELLRVVKNSIARSIEDRPFYKP